MEKQKQKPKSVPVLPWMRSPVDVSLFEDSPLHLLPYLDPRYLFCLFFFCFVCKTFKELRLLGSMEFVLYMH